MAKFEVVSKESLSLVKCELESEVVTTEAGAMYYYKGDIEMTAKMPGVGGLFKSMLTRESVFRPTYEGSGELWLEPSFGNFTIIELNGEEWILDKGAYVASDSGVEVGVYTNKAISGFFSGEGFFQTRVNGNGKVIIASNGPIEEIELNDSRLVVDGKFAVARSGDLEFKVEKSSRGLMSTLVSGEGLVNTFTGTGKVLLAPVPHAFAFITDKIERNFSAITSAQKK